MTKSVETMGDECSPVGWEIGTYPKCKAHNKCVKRQSERLRVGKPTYRLQAPFVSLFLHLNEDEEYIEEMALIIEEVLKQRYLGVKNEQGVYVSPAFPKLLYVLDENNTYKGSDYYYLTELAVKCVSKRIVPDFISAKKMKENYDGEVYPCINILCLQVVIPNDKSA